MKWAYSSISVIDVHETSDHELVGALNHYVIFFFFVFVITAITLSLSIWDTFTFLQALRGILDSGYNLPFPDGLLINGRGANGYTFTVDQGALKLQPSLLGFSISSLFHCLLYASCFMSLTHVVLHDCIWGPLSPHSFSIKGFWFFGNFFLLFILTKVAQFNEEFSLSVLA